MTGEGVGMEHTRRRRRNMNLRGGGATGPVITYLLNDEFTTNEAAPVTTPRTAEPGPGTLTFASSLWEISSSILQPTGEATGTPLPLVYCAGRTRSAGLALHARMAQANGTGGAGLFSPAIAWGTSTAATYSGASGITFTTGQLAMVNGGGSQVEQGIVDIASETYADFDIVLRDNGAFAVVNGQLMGVGGNLNDATMYARAWEVDVNRRIPRIQTMRVAQLGGEWSDSFGIATDRKAGAVSVSTTFNHEANAFWTIFTVTTLPGSGNIEIDIRRQDANNKWLLQVTSAGAFNLIEVVAGTPTTRATIASNANGDILKCVMSGSRARLQRFRSGASTQSAMYTSVATFTTQTAGDLIGLGTGGVISDLQTYPVNLSGNALAWLTALHDV